jgi:hypothetical protein
LLAKFFNTSADYLLGLSDRTSINVEGLREKDIALANEVIERFKSYSESENK